MDVDDVYFQRSRSHSEELRGSERLRLIAFRDVEVEAMYSRGIPYCEIRVSLFEGMLQLSAL